MRDMHQLGETNVAIFDQDNGALIFVNQSGARIELPIEETHELFRWFNEAHQKTLHMLAHDPTTDTSFSANH